MRPPDPAAILTIGHSNLPWEAFLARLHAFDVQILVDVRSLPGSRKWPQFDQEAMEPALAREQIRYVWMPSLGGRRSRGLGAKSPNTAWSNASFRNYADYMLTAPFSEGIRDLLALAEGRAAAMMCAEALYWRCHRRLISDYLVAHGTPVQHIPSTGKLRPHVLTPEARLQPDGKLFYPSSEPGLFPGEPSPGG